MSPPRWSGTGEAPKIKGFAVCPVCGHPLVFTQEFAGKDWICMGCLKVWKLHTPDAVPWTEDLQRMYDNHRDVYDIEREQRRLEGRLGQFRRTIE